MTDQERDALIIALCRGFDTLCERVRFTKWKPHGEALNELLRLCELSDKPASDTVWLLNRIKDVAFAMKYDEQARTEEAKLVENQNEVDRMMAVINTIAKIPEHQK